MKVLLFALLLCGCREAPAVKKITAQKEQPIANQSYGEAETKRLQWFAREAKNWCTAHHYNNRFFFLADLALPSGKNRFFVYDMNADCIICSSLVAHGCCNHSFLQTASFSNEIGCGCSSFGKYKIGGKYEGRYGTAYRLTGLDSSDSNALERNIVLHSYPSVSDSEVYPGAICNSYGCPMVSKHFLQVLETKIDSSSKPVLLWITD